MFKKLLGLLATLALCATAVGPVIAREASPAIRAVAPVQAAPTSPVDETKVPHYFGPYPNWANSQLTLPAVAVTITGDGTGATAAATIGANGAVTGLTITDPGSGYTSASVVFSGAGSAAAATATVTSSGAVTSVAVTAGGTGYVAPTVSFSGGGAVSTTIVAVGNALTARKYATDYATAPGSLGPVFVVIPTTMPAAGVVKEIKYFNQDTAGSSPTPSEGNLFHAYVLRATTAPGEYTVAWDSGVQTVPAAPVGGTVETIPVPDIPVTTGDTIAFYGEGIPLDDNAGSDTLAYPSPTAPILAGTVSLGGTDFPILLSTRTYSFGANVLDNTGIVAPTVPTATVFGGVNAITIDNPGADYTMPTVDIDFPDDPNGTQATAHVMCAVATGPDVACSDLGAATPLVITGVEVDNPGSGYAAAPNVVIRDGTAFDPILGSTPAAATATLAIQSVVLDTFGAGYTSAPAVAITDTVGTGTGATATASTDIGIVSSLALTDGGSGYLTPGIEKFEDALPGLCLPPACPLAGKYIPLGVAEPKVYGSAGEEIAADEYVIGLIQYKTSFSSSLPDTLVRGYVQLETADNADISQHFPLVNEYLDTRAPTPVLIGGVQAYAVTPPQWLGPTIGATKDKPVRIVFHNLLPTGDDGDLFLPVDATLMGSGMGPDMATPPVNGSSVTDDVRNPMCTDAKSMDAMCFTKNRATLHLHGGITPWISDGTPHQWITPAGENAAWPEGVSVGNVPDMNACDADDDGCQTFYYTNQQSARLMFYHDHAWGITRLNVYAGEAAGYLITDDTEKKLILDGTIPGAADSIPLVVQDRTFVPDPVQMAQQDPTWDTPRWGGMGSFWYHHVYMPAQNPGDPSGMSGYGRWMYGPWFWPPASATVYGPIANPYYNRDPKATPPFSQPLAVACDIDNPDTWQYDTDPFCEPKEIPGTPNVSVGMEQFNDTPIVNGVAYPTLTLEPKTYRLRVLNAANDRFFNFQWYEGEESTASTGLNVAGAVIGATEVALKPGEVAAAQTDPVMFPTPVSNAGPDWVQIGTEGGFLPAPVVVDGQQETTWITDPTRFDVGNVDQHSLLLAPAERADVIVDFSKYAGKTLILYNDAPAAFPARVPSYDYYTGAPDTGAGVVIPGYGPNTRTIMQVKIAGVAKPAFNLTKLQNAFKHNANGTGVFESGQHPIIVGQAAYNSAYGTSFAAASNCNAPGSTLTRCDGLVRINDTGTFGFNTLRGPSIKTVMDVQPKAIHDEMNAATFDEYGRMSANLGIEAQPPTPGLQNVTLYPFVNPSTELIDGTKLPKQNVAYDSNGDVVSDVKITPIGTAADDGSQLWRITHNGVDTHPIHFHLYDVQVLNRVAWDNIITLTDKTELGWKDTVRMNPLQDITVALRPIIPEVPWELPNSIRPLNPMMPLGDTTMFNNVDVQGNPTARITNELANFGWEYVYHCHILSHEEMDMMRPVILALPPLKPDGLTASFLGVGATRHVNLTWNDNSINETAFLVQRSTNGTTWTDLAAVLSPLDQPNIHEGRTFDDFTVAQTATTYQYRIVAENKVGYPGANGAFETMAVTSVSEAAIATVTVDPPVAVVTPDPLAFGSIATGTTSASLDVTVRNNGGSALTVGTVSIGGTDLGQFSFVNNCTTAVAPGANCTISVTFTPATDGAKSATLSIAHNAAGTPSLVTLTGTGLLAPPVASVTPTTLAFGSILTGTPSAPKVVTVSNTGPSGLVVGTVSVVGANAGQFVATNNCTTPVAQGADCTISVTFTPATGGAKSATLSIAHNAAGTPSLVNLTGTGVAPTTFSMPITQGFGSKAVGVITLKTVLVTNTGPATLFITSATAAAPFSTVTLGTCASPVNVGKTCKLNVTFAPTSVGSFSVPLVVVSSNATISPPQTTLTGTGR